MISPGKILKKYDVIAFVGASKSPEKEAYTVPAYMKEHGYTIIPVNPSADQILGEKAYKTLMDLPPDLAKKVDIVDVFRPTEELPPVPHHAIKIPKKTGRPFPSW